MMVSLSPGPYNLILLFLILRRLRSTTLMANAAITICVPCGLSTIVDPRRRIAASLESRDAFYVISLLLIIPHITTAGNFATNVLAKYRGNIVAGNNVARCMMSFSTIYVHVATIFTHKSCFGAKIKGLEPHN